MIDNYMNPVAVLIYGLVFGAVCAFIITLADKWGLFEYYQTYRRKWMPRPCTFCFAFWVGVVLLTAHSLAFGLQHVLNFIILAAVIPVIALFLLRRQ